MNQMNWCSVQHLNLVPPECDLKHVAAVLTRPVAVLRMIE